MQSTPQLIIIDWLKAVESENGKNGESQLQILNKPTPCRIDKCLHNHK